MLDILNRFRKDDKQSNKDNSKNKKSGKGSKKQPKVNLSQTFLQEIAPLGNLKFYSDYFLTGVNYGAILTFVADAGAVNQLPPMWGSRMIPVTKGTDVQARLIVAFQTRPDSWVESRSAIATEVSETAHSEAEQANQALEASRSRNRAMDNRISTGEIAAGASYLDVTYKILLYAPTLASLQEAVADLSRLYKTRFGSARLTQNIGQQQDDFRNMLGPATTQLGHHDGYTSIEFAGFYPFVGKGWRDPDGDYVGISVGDVNNTPVMYDSNSTSSVTLIGAAGRALMAGRDKPFEFSAQAAWQTFYVQNELLQGRNVYELVLNNEDPTEIGTNLAGISGKVPMDVGMINPLQAFGEVEDELAAYAILKNKLKAMLQQLNSDISRDDLMLFDESLDTFYIEQGLWAENAQENRDQLRMVGLDDYSQIPQLKHLSIFMNGRYRLYAEGSATIAPNQDMASGYKRLAGMIRSMQSSYGDLFDTVTTFNDSVIRNKPRKVFPFAKLHQKGADVLMAQFINIFSYIIGELERGDVIHLYGAEAITPGVWDYINQQRTFLQDMDVKLVIGFNDVASMIKNPLFSSADTVVSGTMSSTDISRYGDSIQGALPTQLINKITDGNPKHFYLRRPTENRVFRWDLIL